jgi:hypothetical protein
LIFITLDVQYVNQQQERIAYPSQGARSMEHYRQLDEIRKLGLPSDHPFDQAFFTCSMRTKFFEQVASWR